MNRTRGKHMDLKYLQTFLTIVEEGGFSKAAKKLSFLQSLSCTATRHTPVISAKTPMLIW